MSTYTTIEKKFQQTKFLKFSEFESLKNTAASPVARVRESGRTVHWSRRRVGYSLPSLTTMDPSTGIPLSPRYYHSASQELQKLKFCGRTV